MYFVSLSACWMYCWACEFSFFSLLLPILSLGFERESDWESRRNRRRRRNDVECCWFGLVWLVRFELEHGFAIPIPLPLPFLSFLLLFPYTNNMYYGGKMLRRNMTIMMIIMMFMSFYIKVYMSEKLYETEMWGGETGNIREREKKTEGDDVRPHRTNTKHQQEPEPELAQAQAHQTKGYGWNYYGKSKRIGCVCVCVSSHTSTTCINLHKTPIQQPNFSFLPCQSQSVHIISPMPMLRLYIHPNPKWGTRTSRLADRTKSWEL